MIGKHASGRCHSLQRVCYTVTLSFIFEPRGRQARSACEAGDTNFFTLVAIAHSHDRKQRPYTHSESCGKGSCFWETCDNLLFPCFSLTRRSSQQVMHGAYGAVECCLQDAAPLTSMVSQLTLRPHFLATTNNNDRPNCQCCQMPHASFALAASQRFRM